MHQSKVIDRIVYNVSIAVIELYRKSPVLSFQTIDEATTAIQRAKGPHMRL